jgi:alanine racemase
VRTLSPIEPPAPLLEGFTPVDTSEARVFLPEPLPLSPPPRPAWVEIDLTQLRLNFQIINRDKPTNVALLSIIKDEAYGHGALQVARIALESGVQFLGVSTVEEAMRLRDNGVKAPILLLGDRHEAELPWCIAHNLTCCVSEARIVRKLAQLAALATKRVPIHLKVNTGMNRYGIRWDQAGPLLDLISASRSLELEGVLSHFAQSDELDKSFALLQLERFRQVLATMETSSLRVKFRLWFELEYSPWGFIRRRFAAVLMASRPL